MRPGRTEPMGPPPKRTRTAGECRGVWRSRIEGVERWFLRKNEVLLKVKKKGKTCPLEVRTKL